VVLCFIKLLRLSYTNYSVYESKALVASSNNKRLPSLKIALAMAILCFYPPEIYAPFGPTDLLNPFPASRPLVSPASN